ncbi:ribosome maturation factor RimM [Agromyces sp. MMS24-JH15]|uniref:ribosome maturation factor RimM n=1 Tax=Agromyces sp. MMS24-JH15 TaxID=3243765 RepID=UPI003748D79E
MASQPRPQQLRVGRLTKAHGLKGAIKLELFTDDPARRFVPGAVFSLQVPDSSPWHGRTLTFRELRWYNAQPVGFFEGIEDRNDAEGVVKAILWVDVDDAEAGESEPDAWYDHQLVGLAVIRDGAPIGEVARVDHFPAQDLLVVKTKGREVMVPFVQAIVPEVDLEAGTLTVTPPNGLFEDLPDEDEGGNPAAEDGEPAEDAEPGEAADEPAAEPGDDDSDSGSGAPAPAAG